jgi:hypothetical protein
MRNPQKILVRMPEGKRPLAVHGWEIFKKDLEDAGYEGVGSIEGALRWGSNTYSAR